MCACERGVLGCVCRVFSCVCEQTYQSLPVLHNLSFRYSPNIDLCFFFNHFAFKKILKMSFL